MEYALNSTIPQSRRIFDRGSAIKCGNFGTAFFYEMRSLMSLKFNQLFCFANKY